MTEAGLLDASVVPARLRPRDKSAPRPKHAPASRQFQFSQSVPCRLRESLLERQGAGCPPPLLQSLCMQLQQRQGLFGACAVVELGLWGR